jgi:ABC-type Na+ transport system ATPase subunit NatA
VTIGINDGDRIGIVGRNGDGKSTLMKILAKTLEPDSGRVTHRSNLRIGMLDQSDTLDPSMTIGQAVVGEQAEHVWAGNAKVRDVIGGLLNDLDWTKPVGELSGGQRRRVALAALLANEVINTVAIVTRHDTHARFVAQALQAGKHVFVEKPLAHTFQEVDLMIAAEKKYKVVAQMGNQGHSGNGVRELCEMVWSGAVGQIKESHTWTNRPIWDQGVKQYEKAEVPATLDWSLWQAAVPEQPLCFCTSAMSVRCTSRAMCLASPHTYRYAPPSSSGHSASPCASMWCCT